jgi:hydroxyacylglutathione hydrolase
MDIRPIVLGGFSANCYLLSEGESFVLIDTGRATGLKRLEKALADAGCRPGGLRLILLTHGDFDHSGNCAALRRKYSAPVAVHKDDAGMVETGDMFWNRKSGGRLIKKLVNAFFRIELFKPDFTVDDGFDLGLYGIDAKVLHLPGHSRGSIGVLAGTRDLFCGDLLAGGGKPAMGSIIDDPDAAAASVERLKKLPIRSVYPGHGKPFSMSDFKF